MAANKCTLSWNDHHNVVVSYVGILLEENLLTDCTLAAEGHQINAHKLVLSACSPYLKMLLCEEYVPHPIIIFQDIKFQDLKTLMDFMYKGEIHIPEERVGCLLEIAQTLQMGNISIGMEMQETVIITQIPTDGEDLPSTSRLYLRRDLLGKSGESVEQCSTSPFHIYENNETGGDLSPLLPESEFVQCGSSSPISSLFIVASPSCLFQPGKDPLSECEEHFEAGRILDGSEDTKDVKGLVGVVEHSLYKEAVPQFREENLKRPPCGALATSFFPACEHIAAGTQTPVEISLTNQLNSSFGNELEESVEIDRSEDDLEDRKDEESLVDIVERSVSEDAGDELGVEKQESIYHSSTSPSILPGKKLVAGPHWVAVIPSPDEGCSGSADEDGGDIGAEESEDDLGDCIDVEGRSETVVNSAGKDQAGEVIKLQNG